MLLLVFLRLLFYEILDLLDSTGVCGTLTLRFSALKASVAFFAHIRSGPPDALRAPAAAAPGAPAVLCWVFLHGLPGS